MTPCFMVTLGGNCRRDYVTCSLTVSASLILRLQVRQAIEKMYGIDRNSFYLWFKNRAPQARRTKPSKPSSPSPGSGTSSPTSSSPPVRTLTSEAGLFELSDMSDVRGSMLGSSSAAAVAHMMQAGQLGSQLQLQSSCSHLLPGSPAVALMPQPADCYDNAQLQQLLLSQLASRSQASHEPNLQLGLSSVHSFPSLQAPLLLGVSGGLSQAGLSGTSLNSIGAHAGTRGMQQTTAQPLMASMPSISMQLEQQPGINNTVRLVLLQAPANQQMQQQQAQQQAQLAQQQQQQRTAVFSSDAGRAPLAAAIQQYHELSCRSGTGFGGMNLVLASAAGIGSSSGLLGQPVLLSQQGLSQQAGLQGQVSLQQLGGLCRLPTMSSIDIRPTSPTAPCMSALRNAESLGLGGLQGTFTKATRTASEPQVGQSTPTLDNLLDMLRKTGYTPWTLDSRSPCQSTSTAGSLPTTISL